MNSALAELHNRIDDCTVCSSFVRPFNKPAPGLDRGEGNEIFIVGQAPGRTEVKSKRAFSGGSGSRLDEWLTQCGRPAEDPRRGVYLTSILKCPMNNKGEFRGMARRCHHFLKSQLEIIRPKLVITLGQESFEYLRIVDGEYNELLCRLFLPADHSLLPHQPFGALMHWPHPSGLNRWHNVPENKIELDDSFAVVKEFLQGASL